MYSYQLTPIGAPMPTLFVSEEICAISAVKGGGFSFSVRGGKPRATISWMVTTVELQMDESKDDDKDEDDLIGSGAVGSGKLSRTSSHEGGEGWGVAQKTKRREG